MNTNELEDRLEQIKKNTATDPVFTKLYPIIEEILKSSKPTDILFCSAVQVFREEILSSITNDKVKKFLELPACKGSNVFTRSVLNTILVKTLEQAIKESNCYFSFFIKEDFLLENGFILTGKDGEPDCSIIDSLSNEIKLDIPRLNICYQGNPKTNGEIWLSGYYNYNYKP